MKARTFLKFSFFCLAIVAVAGFSLFHFRWSIFPFAVGNRIDMLLQGSLLDKRAAYVTPAKTFFLEADDGLRLAADLYLPPDNQEAAPAVVMLHGSSRWGRKIGITRLLSRGLAEQGYVVLAIDFRAFGDSENPFPLDDPSSWRMEKDIRAGVDFLAAEARVDKEKIYLVGHSMGAAYGMYSGVKEGRIRKIVAIGPPRRVKERLRDEQQDFLERFLRDRELEEEPLSLEVFAAIGEPYSTERTYRYFRQPGHKPLLLIDGMLEDSEDRAYLRQQYERMSEPKQYVTMEGTCHYFGIVGLEWFKSLPVVRGMLIYDRKTVAEAVALIDGFLRDGADN